MKKTLLKVAAISMALLGFGANSYAQAPAQCEDVMLQAFYWDSYKGGGAYGKTQWVDLWGQKEELASTFTLLWLPPSGNGNGNGVGYHPVHWANQNSDWGTASTLKQLNKYLLDNGSGAVADIVVNHRSGNSNWTDFPRDNFGSYGSFQLGPQHICNGDEVKDEPGQARPTGAADTGENWSGSRDLDHTSSDVQNAIKAYLKYLKSEYHYKGWRWDVTKGFSGWFVGQYCDAAQASFSVGEYWDGDQNKLNDWVNNAEKKSTTFDFSFKYAMRDAGNNFGWMAENNKVKGYIAWQPRYSTTMIDNHDTFKQDGGKYNGDWTKANALMLAAPGVPCVFWPHWYTCKDAIKEMVKVRRACGVHSESAMQTTGSSGQNYYSKATGKRADLICKIGDTSAPAGFKKACGGEGWAYFVPNDFDVDGNAPVSGPSVSASPKGGLYIGGTSVTLTATGGEGTVKIYYTTNGSTPSASSTLYTGAISITSETTLKAIAIDATGAKSGVISETYITEGNQYVLKFKAPAGWTTCKLWAWTTGNTNGADIAGGATWPGDATMQLGSDGYFSYTVDVAAGTTFNVIFNNDNNGEQTVDLTASASTCWDVGTGTTTDGNTKYAATVNANCSSDPAPGPAPGPDPGADPTPDPSGSVTLKFKAPAGWTSCNIWAWADGDASLIGGAAWPGVAMTLDSDGFYKYTITGATGNVNFLFNNGTDQTLDGLTTVSSCWAATGTKVPNGMGKQCDEIEESTDCTPTAVEDVLTTKATIFPNPASDYINIIADKAAVSAVITSLDGRSYQVEISNNQADLSEFNKGMYIMNITFDDNTTSTNKVIKK